MEVDVLLPMGVKEEVPTINLEQIQEEADAAGILLPTEFNRQVKNFKKQDDEGSGILLPIGM